MGKEMQVVTPSWWHELKAEARRRISFSPLVVGCRTGDLIYIRALTVIFWQFVDEFPDILFRQFNNSNDRLVQKMSSRLSGITNDEKSHRRLWLKTADCIGLTPEYLFSRREQFPKVAVISLCLSEQNRVLTFLRIVGVEIVAEMLSHELLDSERFNTILEEEGKIWFKIHTVHKGTTHEQLALRVACKGMDVESEATRQIIEEAVLHIVDLFVEAASDVSNIIPELVKIAA